MLLVSVSDLKANAAKYISMVENEDIYITKNGKTVAKLVSPKKDKMSAAVSLFDILPAGIDTDAVKTERFL